MGKRGKRRENNGNSASSSSGFHTSLSLREEASGKKQFHNAKSILKLKHFQNLAQWAAGQAAVGCLGAFFGCRFAEYGESLGIPPDPSLFPCQRCETILQPGFNCTIRVEKLRAKRSRKRSKTKSPTKNNVVYTCCFCLHRNLKRGTPEGYMEEITRSKASTLKSKSVNSTAQKCVIAEESKVNDVKTDKANEAPTPAINNGGSPLTDSLTSPLASSGPRLLDSKPRKRKKSGLKGLSGESIVSSAPAESEKSSGTSKKRKKSWTSLKDIAENEEQEKNQRFTNFSIPFVL